MALQRGRFVAVVVAIVGIAIGEIGVFLDLRPLGTLVRWQLALISVGTLIAGWGIALALPGRWRRFGIAYMKVFSVVGPLIALLLWSRLPS